ncbi:Solute-binding protein [bioreactor metagenome]|uniref:Solute-binding protein n=1 Tax=bioreactor metagenome TaxID=1076179 RepID=A0A644Y900_9ZZZZ
MKQSKLAASAIVGLISLSLAACGSGGESGGKAEQVVFKLAVSQPQEHPQYQAGLELGKRLEEATDGRYSVQVYGNETLGTSAEVIQNLSNGTVDFAWIGGANVESLNQDFVVYNLPFVFDSREAQLAVLNDDELNTELFTSLEDSKSITVLGGANAGQRSIYNAIRPIRTPDDLKGLKIRVQQSDSQVRMLQLLGGIPSPMSFGEVYSALQTGVLDGAENNEPSYNAMKHDEVAKYYSYTRHLMIPDFLLMSTQTLDKMDEKDRDALLAIIPDITQKASDDFVPYVNESIERSKALGAQFNDDVDTAAFKARVAPMVEEYMGANDLRAKYYEATQQANQDNPA